MSITKDAIESANKLANYIVTMSENKDDPDYMYDQLFTTLFSLLKAYDSETLKNLNKNLDE